MSYKTGLYHCTKCGRLQNEIPCPLCYVVDGFKEIENRRKKETFINKVWRFIIAKHN